MCDRRRENGKASPQVHTGTVVARAPIEHKVKSWPPLFEATLLGVKKHELRRATDRDYRIGDILCLQEYDPDSQRYTGRELRVTITYVTSAEFPCALSDGGLSPGFCLLSVANSE